jgi:uncharacterized protein
VAIQLTPVQRRVLGVLIEKSMTTPGSYPLTLNAIVTGCNQLSCREPVMRLTEGEVARAVHELQQMLLVRQADVDPSARSNRFQHLAEQCFGWARRERALMAELLLRGPQTVGELKGNASRMTPLDDLQGVSALLAELASAEGGPYVRELPKQPGRSTVRYDHLFYAPDETRSPEPVAAPSPVPQHIVEHPASPGLETRLERLEGELGQLRDEVQELKRRLSSH